MQRCIYAWNFVFERQCSKLIVQNYISNKEKKFQTTRRKKGMLKNKPTVVKGKKVGRLE